VRLILLQQATENFKEAKTKQRRNDQETKKQNETRKQQQQQLISNEFTMNSQDPWKWG